jgi:small acid-soluble spore protein H (minor)
MDPSRARDISGSPIMMHVTHNGVPVYIECISNDETTAYVHPLDQPNNRQKVNISSLTEQ